MAASAPLPGVPDEATLQRWLDTQFFETDLDTPAAHWGAGERMDWDMAIGNYFQ
jgi:hypothetical protein